MPPILEHEAIRPSPHFQSQGLGQRCRLSFFAVCQGVQLIFNHSRAQSTTETCQSCTVSGSASPIRALRILGFLCNLTRLDPCWGWFGGHGMRLEGSRIDFQASRADKGNDRLEITWALVGEGCLLRRSCSPIPQIPGGYPQMKGASAMPRLSCVRPGIFT